MLKKGFRWFKKKIEWIAKNINIKNIKIENLNKLINEEQKKFKEKEEEINILTKSKNKLQKKMEKVQSIITDADFEKNEYEAPPLSVKNKIEKVENENVFMKTDSNFYQKKDNKGNK